LSGNLIKISTSFLNDIDRRKTIHIPEHLYISSPNYRIVFPVMRTTITFQRLKTCSILLCTYKIDLKITLVIIITLYFLLLFNPIF